MRRATHFLVALLLFPRVAHPFSLTNFWQALGLVWTVQLLRGTSSEDGPRWKALSAAVECCVPEEKREQLSEILENQAKELWTTVLSQAAGITFTLGLGWAVHVFLA
jgi:hypothetical protein